MLSHRKLLLAVSLVAALSGSTSEASLIGDSISLSASYQGTTFYGPIQATGSEFSLEWQIAPFLKIDVVDDNTITAYLELDAGGGVVGKNQGPIDLLFTGIDLAGSGFVAGVSDPTIIGTGSYTNLAVVGPDSISLQGIQLAVGTHGNGESLSSLSFDVQLTEVSPVVPEPYSLMGLSGLTLSALAISRRQRRQRR